MQIPNRPEPKTVFACIVESLDSRSDLVCNWNCSKVSSVNFLIMLLIQVMFFTADSISCSSFTVQGSGKVLSVKMPRTYYQFLEQSKNIWCLSLWPLDFSLLLWEWLIVLGKSRQCQLVWLIGPFRELFFCAPPCRWFDSQVSHGLRYPHHPRYGPPDTSGKCSIRFQFVLVWMLWSSNLRPSAARLLLVDMNMMKLPNCVFRKLHYLGTRDEQHYEYSTK